MDSSCEIHIIHFRVLSPFFAKPHRIVVQFPIALVLGRCLGSHTSFQSDIKATWNNPTSHFQVKKHDINICFFSIISPWKYLTSCSTDSGWNTFTAVPDTSVYIVLFVILININDTAKVKVLYGCLRERFHVSEFLLCDVHYITKCSQSRTGRFIGVWRCLSEFILEDWMAWLWKWWSPKWNPSNSSSYLIDWSHDETNNAQLWKWLGNPRVIYTCSVEEKPVSVRHIRRMLIILYHHRENFDVMILNICTKR